ncbi:30S ribosomal protein S4 [Anaeropeptidivorans aminofermentans]|jgi:small subunit ribosomal protein S4|uniref:30S ribosomal protein S4 n=1 Tax=Anaeropeptidivorans aminofermentans TaxID=2934315 RepID=UPI002024B32D|nr:30S ribosomal protein S4 [Anaeropeptidivorans aminofermentans]MBE6012236.1 30S ribosomal protein S4 [Lachnospiraceae bacterium]
MARNMEPVLKRCKALGIEPMVLGINKKSKREVSRGNRKVSEYGLQLREKQKAKFIYGVLEKQFRIYFAKAEKQPGITGENLLRMLETRLDNVVYRLGYGRTRKEARQIVGHKLILVNGKSVNIPSYRVKAGDVISVRDKSANLQRFKDVLEVTESRIVPEWLSADHEKLTGTVLNLPSREQMSDIPVNETLIVELYSK